MTNDLEIRSAQEITRKRMSISRSICKRVGLLIGLGFSLGLVLFVALTTVSLMDRGSHLAWASWQNFIKEEPKPKALVMPALPSVRKAEPYRPVLSVQRQGQDYNLVRERRLLLSDMWSRFNQTLSTARSFTK